MKTEKNILIAFILNLSFSIFEFFGGAITGSVSIISDAIHDIGDAISIGLSYFFEKKSKKSPDSHYTYGYLRYSVIGSVITTLILLLGSVFVVYNAIIRLFNPVEINYNGMILFAMVGTILNLIAAWYTKDGESLNQKAVNLHMLEDVLGWIAVLIGSIIIRFTKILHIDSLLSILIALYIFVNALINLKTALDLFLEKTPSGISINQISDTISHIDGVLDVHHIHIWSMDGYNNYATMHIITESDSHSIKDKVREKLKEYNIGHITLELEKPAEHCHETTCNPTHTNHHLHHHHH